MAEPIWMSYVGMVGGIVGTMIGIYGAATANRAMRLTATHKRLDLHLSLTTELAELRKQVEELPPLFDRAAASRRSVMAAAGILHSGTAEQFNRKSETDRDVASCLLNKVAEAGRHLDAKTEEAIASGIAEVRLLASQVFALHSTYIAELAADDAFRRDRAAANRNSIRPK